MTPLETGLTVAVSVLAVALIIACWRWWVWARDCHEYEVDWREQRRDIRQLRDEVVQVKDQRDDARRAVERLRAFASEPNIGAAWRAVQQAHREGVEEGAAEMRRLLAGRIERLRLSEQRTRELMASAQARSPEPTAPPERARPDVPLRRFARLDMDP